MDSVMNALLYKLINWNVNILNEFVLYAYVIGVMLCTSNECFIFPIVAGVYKSGSYNGFYVILFVLNPPIIIFHMKNSLYSNKCMKYY